MLPIQAAFNDLATQGIRLDQYCALTHPSEPNYVASVGGDFFGMGDDNLYNIPPKCVTTASSQNILHPDSLSASPLLWTFWKQRTSLGRLTRRTFRLMDTRVSSESEFHLLILSNSSCAIIAATPRRIMSIPPRLTMSTTCASTTPRSFMTRLHQCPHALHATVTSTTLQLM